MHFFLKDLPTASDGVGMSDTNRHMTHRRPPARAIDAPPMGAPPLAAASRVEALRQLVAAGQYQVSARWLATSIFRAAGVPLPK
jgi:anti-sigma28 factor (negative regulator of flagellin synthesis)